MAAKPSWEDRARRFLKAELARADVGYRELAERLKKTRPVRDRGEHCKQDQPGNVPGNVFAGVAHCD
jgi:hypothetical protein